MTDPSSTPDGAPQAARPAVRVSILITLVLGLLIGAAGTYLVMRTRGVPAVVQGTVSGIAEDSHGNVTAIAFRFDDHDYALSSEGESLPVVAEVPWTDAAGQNYLGDRPACLAPGSHGQRIELGVLDVRGEGSWYSQVVVWVHCLS